MRFAVVVNASHGVRNIIQAAQRAEDSGLDYFSTDHYMTPSSNAGVDAWSTLAAVAAITNRIRIGTCVTPVTFRPPRSTRENRCDCGPHF
ncbi:MAG: LLM class flavin-dependent oxidoreductase [Nitrososphaerota archaeon]|nr:LLM class flavin-dependent oxidoreductase [Nitrososphaerota archaeon]